jgi:hypothetical protein
LLYDGASPEAYADEEEPCDLSTQSSPAGYRSANLAANPGMGRLEPESVAPRVADHDGMGRLSPP